MVNFINNSLKSFSYQQGNLYFNAPRNKGFISFSKDNLFDKNLWVQLTANFSEEFDFVSGYHVGTENRNTSSLSPNLIYSNEGALGGNVLINLKFRYLFNNNISIRFMLNNITNKDGPRILGTPRIVRNYLFDVNYSL